MMTLPTALTARTQNTVTAYAMTEPDAQARPAPMRLARSLGAVSKIATYLGSPSPTAYHVLEKPCIENATAVVTASGIWLGGEATIATKAIPGKATIEMSKRETTPSQSTSPRSADLATRAGPTTFQPYIIRAVARVP